MGERKVLNKYYPPDFDPTKIPRRRMALDRQFKVRLMAPFNMRCKGCGEYVYKGKKFNAAKETVLGEEYLGLRVFRFYIRCPRCSNEIAFKTDPRNADYICEIGATRNFEHWRVRDKDEEAEDEAKKEQEELNPMAALENRTIESRQEMDILDALEEIKDSNTRTATLDLDALLRARTSVEQDQAEIERELGLEMKDDDIHALFADRGKRLESSSDEEGDDDSKEHRPAKQSRTTGASDAPGASTAAAKTATAAAGSFEKKAPAKGRGGLGLGLGLVKVRPPLSGTGVYKASATTTTPGSTVPQTTVAVKSTLSASAASVSAARSTAPAVAVAASGLGLGLVAGYSDSDD